MLPQILAKIGTLFDDEICARVEVVDERHAVGVLHLIADEDDVVATGANVTEGNLVSYTEAPSAA